MARKLTKEQREQFCALVLAAPDQISVRKWVEMGTYALADLDEAEREIAEEIRCRFAVEDTFKELHAKLAEAQEDHRRVRDECFAWIATYNETKAKLAEAEAHYKRAYANGWNDAKERESIELEALREVERAARPIKLTLCAAAASAYIHELSKALAAVDALRKGDK